MSGITASHDPRRHDPPRRPLRLAQREQDARELDWQRRRIILPLL